MKKKMILVIVGMMMALGSFSYQTWTDPKAGIAWNYELNGGEVAIGVYDPSPSKSTETAVPRSIMGEIIIPSEIDGYPVTSILDAAFQGCDQLILVTIPEGVTSIGGGVFYDCDRIERIEIPSTVMEIGDRACAHCTSLTGICVSASNSSYKSEDGILFDKSGMVLIQYPCGKGGSYVVPDGVVSIGDYAFYHSGAVSNIIVSSGVLEVGASAFRNCSSLSLLTISSSVTNLKNRALNSSLINDGEIRFEGAPPSGIGNAQIKTDVCMRYNVVYEDEWLPVIEQCGFTNATAYDPRKPDGGPYTEVVDGIEWTFMVVNGEAHIKGNTPAVSGQVVGTVVIPATLGGRTVTVIGYYSFWECNSIEAFEIPSTVTNISKYAFGGCRGLKTFTVLSGNMYYCADGGVLFTKDLAEVVRCPEAKTGDYSIPQGATSIGDSAFSGCTGLTSVVMAEGMQNIGKSAFGGCRSLTSISIPASVTNITTSPFTSGPPHPFYGCIGLKSFDVSEENAYYKSVDGVLFNKNGTLLICCPANGVEEYVVPDDVTEISGGAFDLCAELNKVTVPSDVTRIGQSAFPDGTSIDFEGLPPEGLSDAFVNQSTAIRYNVAYEDEWLPVIAECGFTNATPYTPPKPDGGPYTETIDGIEWTFMVMNGEAMIKGIPIDTSGRVVIPAELGSRTVTGVDSYVLYYCDKITSIAIPPSVSNFNEYAFLGSVMVKRVEFEGLPPSNLLNAIPGAWSKIFYNKKYSADWESALSSVGIDDGVPYDPASGAVPGQIVFAANLTVTNVVVQYVLNSIQPNIAGPISPDTGFVTVITEVKSSGAVSVPSEWSANYPSFTTKYGSDFGKALMKRSGKKDGAGNDMFVWQDYVAGTDPTNPEDKFTASITIVEGVPVISYTPELTAEQKALRVYKTYGKQQLQDANWTDITNLDGEGKAPYNFFKVTVEMK